MVHNISFWKGGDTESLNPHPDESKALYRSGMLDRHLVAVLPNNIFVTVSKTRSFYEKCQRTVFVFACHKILHKT